MFFSTVAPHTENRGDRAKRARKRSRNHRGALFIRVTL